MVNNSGSKMMASDKCLSMGLEYLKIVSPSYTIRTKLKEIN